MDSHSENEQEHAKDPAESQLSPIDPFDDLKEKGVRVEIEDNRINIVPSRDVYFTASANQERLLRLAVRTIRENGGRSPYFEQHRVSELARRAIEHFDRSGKLRGIEFDWGKPPTDEESQRSDNYTSYITMRNLFSKGLPPEEARIKAAESTWTYEKIAKPNGFTQIQSVVEKGDATQPTTVTGIMLRSSE